MIGGAEKNFSKNLIVPIDNTLMRATGAFSRNTEQKPQRILATMKNDLIKKYITETYSPEAIIVYGSYADGSANENSDFDALVITDSVKKHDSSEVDNTILDVWIYPSEYFIEEYDPNEFIQIFDGNIVLDKNGTAKELKRKINEYIDQLPLKTDEEISQEIDWCDKMFLRAKRGDAEGLYRWHWLLFDSLVIYYDVKKLHYHGPKKALRYMEKEDPEAFRLYSAALSELNTDYLGDWIAYLKITVFVNTDIGNCNIHRI